MRCLAILVALTTSAAADDAEPPFPAFDHAGTFHVLVLDGARVRCEAWRVAPGGTLTRPDGSVLGFRSRGAWIIPASMAHGSLPVAEVGDIGDITVDGGRWFATARGCQAARKRHDAVATELDSWRAPAAPSAKVLAATRARVEAVLGDGGALYTLDGDRCSRVSVHGHAVGDRLTGELIAISEDATSRTISTHPYDLVRGATTISMLPGTSHTIEKVRDPDAIGTGQYGCICVDDAPLELAPDEVSFAGVTYYANRDACRAAAATRRVRISWLP